MTADKSINFLAPSNSTTHWSRLKDYTPSKKVLYLSVNVFSTNVLIEDTSFMPPSGDGTDIVGSHPSHMKV